MMHWLVNHFSILLSLRIATASSDLPTTVTKYCQTELLKQVFEINIEIDILSDNDAAAERCTTPSDQHDADDDDYAVLGRVIEREASIATLQLWKEGIGTDTTKICNESLSFARRSLQRMGRRPRRLKQLSLIHI